MTEAKFSMLTWIRARLATEYATWCLSGDFDTSRISITLDGDSGDVLGGLVWQPTLACGAAKQGAARDLFAGLEEHSLDRLRRHGGGLVPFSLPEVFICSLTFMGGRATCKENGRADPAYRLLSSCCTNPAMMAPCEGKHCYLEAQFPLPCGTSALARKSYQLD
eukprot:s3466_g1.t1